MWVYISLFLILYNNKVVDSTTNETHTIRIGGLFTPFNTDGTRNETGAQGLAAFLLAIQEINNRTDLLPNHKLIYEVSDPTLLNDAILSIDAATYLIKSAFSGSGVQLVIGGIDNSPTMTTNKLLNNYEMIQISSVASSGYLSVGSDYPFKFRVVPSDSFSGMTNQYFGLYRMGYTRVLTFTLDDFTQSKASDDLNDATWATPVFLDQIVIDPTKTRYTKAILQAKATGAQVFFLYLDAGSTGRLLEQGNSLGLFREGTIVFGCYENSGPAVYKSMSASAPVAKIMKGYLGIERIPNFSVLNTAIGQQFVAKWRAQAATLSTDGSGNVVCSNVTDAGGTSLLSRNISSTMRCAGYDFSTFDASGSTLNPSAPHTYDAVYAAVYGLHSLLYKTGATNITTHALMDTLKINVSFQGVTGLIEFTSGMILVNGEYVNVGDITATDDGVNSGGLSDYFARGDRESGVHFKIVNFNEASYNADKINGGFVQVGLFNVEDRFQLCGDPSTESIGLAYTCINNIIYNTFDNSKPLERPVPIKEYMVHDNLRLISTVFNSIGLFCIVFISIILFIRQKHALVKAVQPPMIALILFGMLIGIGRAMIILYPLSDTVCIAEVVIGHFAFFVVFVTLYIKTWRINRLMFASGFEKVKITNRDALMIVACRILLLCVLLVVVVGVGNPMVDFEYSDVQNQESYAYYCSATNPTAEVALFVIEIIILLVGASLARTVSELPGAVNESKNVLMGILIITITGGIIYPITKLGIVDPVFARWIESIAFAINVILCSISLYGQRVYQLLSGYKVSTSLRLKPKIEVGESEEAADEKKQLFLVAKSTLRAVKNEKGKIDLCVKQIEQWYSFLSVLTEVNGEQQNQLAVNMAMSSHKFKSSQHSDSQRIGNNSTSQQQGSGNLRNSITELGVKFRKFGHNRSVHPSSGAEHRPPENAEEITSP